MTLEPESLTTLGESLLNAKFAVKKSEKLLSLVTSSMEETGLVKTHPLQIHKLEDGSRLNIRVGTKGELDLDSFLPENVSFVSGPAFTFNKKRGRLVIPINKKELANCTSFRIKLAHEIGHGLDPDYEELDIRCQNEDDSFEALLSAENARLQMEVNAWNYGKSIANIMGVDEIQYEDAEHFALRAYLMSTLEKLAIAISDSDSNPPESFQLYNPISQDYEDLTIDEFNQKVNSLYETEEISSAMETLKLHY